MTTEVRRSALITDGMQSGWTTLRDPVLSSSTSAPALLEWPCQEEPGSGLTASAPVLDVSAPACTNGAWPPLQCGAEEQNRQPCCPQCPIYRPPHGLHRLTVRDDETTKWLLNTCPEI